MKIALAGVLCASLSFPAFGATIINGSLTGPVGNNVLPSGWIADSFSPDTNNLATAGGGGFNYVVAPTTESSDGGTWVGIALGTGTFIFIERFSQTISDFIVGKTYTLRWEQYNSGATFASGYTNSNAFLVSLDGIGVGTGAISALGGDWLSTGASFMASSTTHSLGFRLAEPVSSYMNIDGIHFVSAPVPLPATGWLMLVGLGGLGLLRLRRKMP